MPAAWPPLPSTSPLAWAFTAMPASLAHGSCVRTDHAAVRVRDSYSGCSRLAKLAIAAMETVGSSCAGAGIACQQCGTHPQ